MRRHDLLVVFYFDDDYYDDDESAESTFTSFLSFLNFQGFMSAPVSEENERLVVNAVIDACQNALSEMEGDENDNSTLSEKQQLCAMVRNSERQALERTCVYMKQEAEALDLKEYYQERRLKSLGLDSEWSPENDDVGWGGNRVPGGADYDW